MIPFSTQSVSPATGHGPHGRGENPPRYNAAGGDQTTEFSPDSIPAAIGRPNADASQDHNRALATARDVLNFRLQITPLPGPGSVAQFVAQQIGQMWIAPETQSNPGSAAAAYERATGTADFLHPDAMRRELRV